MTSTYYCLQKKAQDLKIYEKSVFPGILKFLSFGRCLPSLEPNIYTLRGRGRHFWVEWFSFCCRWEICDTYSPFTARSPTFARDDSATSFISCCVLTSGWLKQHVTSWLWWFFWVKKKRTTDLIFSAFHICFVSFLFVLNIYPLVNIAMEYPHL